MVQTINLKNVENAPKEMAELIKTTYEEFLEIGEKQPIYNIVFSKVTKWGVILGRYLHLVLDTPENSACNYNKNKWQIVFRVVYDKKTGTFKLVLEDGEIDRYTWSDEDLSKAKVRKEIGYVSLKSLFNLLWFCRLLKDKNDRKLLKQQLKILRLPFILAYTPAEQRKCLIVTQELLDAGLTFCIDEWENPDENGKYHHTELKVGDVLVFNKTVYRVEASIANKTYKFKKIK